MELQVLEQNVIVQAFATQGGTEALFERIAEQARSFVPDVTTKKGREEIGSVAMKVSKSKTLTEKYAKDLVAEEKARIKLIDDDRIQFCKKMDALRDEILAPRDAWEQAERNRKAKHENFISEIKKLSIQDNSSSQMIRDDIDFLTNEVVVDSSLEDYEQEAKLAKFETLEALRTTLAAREKYEAEQAEREAFEQAERIRWQKDHDERIAREATEKAQREAEEKARFEAERVQREKAESEQREARLKAEKEAAELREQALKQKAIDDAKQAEIAKQQAIEAERKRIEAEQFAQVEAVRKAEEARQADVEHRRWINNEALIGFTSQGFNDDIAKKIIAVIAKNQIPHVSIKY